MNIRDNDFKEIKIPDNMKERFNNSDTKIIIVSTESYSSEDLDNLRVCVNHPCEEGCLKDGIGD